MVSEPRLLPSRSDPLKASRARAGLFASPDFMKLWAAQTVSLLGSSITGLALPLAAALALSAGPAEMGALSAAGTLPFLLIGLFAGVWVDRLRRRPILIAADVARAVLLLTIPLAALAGVLRIELLYAVAFLCGICTVFFDVAYQSYLPALVSRQALVEGNSKLEVSRSAVHLAGPGLAGGLITLVTAPVAIVVDALSFALSALFLGAIRTPEPPPVPSAGRPSVWREIGEGLRLVLGSPILRPIAACTATSNFFSSFFFAGFILYLTRDLGLDPAALGLVFGLGSAGFIAGAALAERSARWLGFGPALIAATVLVGAGALVHIVDVGPAGPPGSAAFWLVIGIQMLGQLLASVALPVYNINQVSLRQAITPDRLMGRMNATTRFLVWGTMPLGALAGGAVAEWIGLVPALQAGALGSLLAAFWIVFSPVRTLRDAATLYPDETSPQSAS